MLTKEEERALAAMFAELREIDEYVDSRLISMKSCRGLVDKHYREALEDKRRQRNSRKEGRAISSANSSRIQGHVDTLHSVADDLAGILQGSEGAYGSDPGNAGDQQEGSKSRYGRYASSSFGYEVKALDERVTVQREQKASTIPVEAREWDFRSFARTLERKLAR